MVFTNAPASSSSSGLNSSSFSGFFSNTICAKPWSMLYKGLILDPCFNKLFAVSFLRPSLDALRGVLGVFGGEDVSVCAGGVVCLAFSDFPFFALPGEWP